MARGSLKLTISSMNQWVFPRSPAAVTRTPTVAAASIHPAINFMMLFDMMRLVSVCLVWFICVITLRFGSQDG
jgi:hypothetical protein